MLEIKNIYFTYPAGVQQDYTLADITIDIGKGEFIGIFGPNGSGKSTLLKIVSGLIKPQKGVVNLLGTGLNNLKKQEIAARIAFVPQASATIFPYTLYEIIAMGRTPYLGIMGFETREDHEKIQNALDMLELSHIASKGINEVSGGEAQRAFIARALVQEPEIILLDEPNSHLDIKHQISIYQLLRKLNTEMDITILAVSHDLNLSANFCRRGILMDHGQIVHDDSIRNILTEDNIKKVFEIDSEVTLRSDENMSIVIKP